MVEILAIREIIMVIRKIINAIMMPVMPGTLRRAMLAWSFNPNNLSVQASSPRKNHLTCLTLLLTINTAISRRVATTKRIRRRKRLTDSRSSRPGLGKTST